MKKMYLSAPLPFVGQKRMFAREFIKVLGQFPDSTVFVDLFGGSGCCHILPNVSGLMPPLCIMTSTTTAATCKYPGH